jgi:hypothetical protein
MRKQTRSQRRQFKIKVPRLLFTLDQLVFLRKALIPLEQIVLLQKEPLPNLQFALATVTQVQAKINLMITRGSWSTGVGFDANEVLILRTAVWIFMAGLEISTSTPDREKLKKQCQTLITILSVSK